MLHLAPSTFFHDGFSGGVFGRPTPLFIRIMYYNTYYNSLKKIRMRKTPSLVNQPVFPDCACARGRGRGEGKGAYQLVYQSPKDLLMAERWRDMLLCPLYTRSLAKT